ncbi:hypothetical protein HPP92_002954 [Vanilla planifolia]|uniref:Uncharacterized protein n=1 Tax=Vanilla planifolia TaxID=51239 RepID=A0A835VL19_VANPL|nr:hypothetical protein HPP92_002954 [Vanilla planifolia]
MAQAKTYRLLSPLTPPLTCDVFTSCSSSLVELSTLLYFPANRLRIPLPLLFPVADESKTPSSLFPPAYYVSKQTIANPEEMCERKREEGHHLQLILRRSLSAGLSHSHGIRCETSAFDLAQTRRVVFTTVLRLPEVRVLRAGYLKG